MKRAIILGTTIVAILVAFVFVKLYYVSEDLDLRGPYPEDDGWDYFV